MLKPKRGFTLIELIVSMGAAVALFAVTFALLQTSVISWRRVAGDQDVSGQLLKAESWLKRDLFATAFTAIDTVDGPVTLTGKDGDAVWFLSAIDPATDQFIRNDDGSPRWQRNILYYSVVPSGLDVEHSGGGIDAGGYEVSYPYKFLVRKVIDNGSVTDPADPATQETLIADITPFLERPVKYNFPSGDSESLFIVARNILSFRVATSVAQRQVNITLQAANVEEAKKLFPIGGQTLEDPQFLMERQFSVYPENRDNLVP
jgi:hypothetical protein